MTSFVQTDLPVSEQILDSKNLNEESLRQIFFSHNQTNRLLDLFKTSEVETDAFIHPFVHSSFTHEINGIELDSNEKLEFLGDALLSVMVSEQLMDDFKDFSEGELSKFRASLVNEETLGILARYLRFDEILVVGRGGTKEKIYQKDGPLADAFEALLGYFYQFRSLEGVRSLFKRIIESYEKEKKEDFFDKEKFLSFDSKSRLQEMTMKKYKSLPHYLAQEKENGFEVALLINDQEILKTTERSKKKAERKLAYEALKNELI